jgi:hypothetical protein
VRHVRMLGLCLVAVFVVCAMAAASAFAKEPKPGYQQFKNCPVNGSAAGKPAFECTFGETRSGAGGSYTVGGITVNITKSIKLQGAFTVPLGETRQEVIEKGRAGLLIPPEDGAPAIVPVAETVPGEVLAHVSQAEMEELGWPKGLQESYKAAQRAHLFREGQTTEVIEPAGLDPDLISVFNLGAEEGPAMYINIQIQGKNKWLEYLGGNCEIGSEAEPIVQTLYTGETESPLTHEIMVGTGGSAQFFHNSRMADLIGTELVANKYAVPAATKCGGASYEAYLDPAVSRAFGLPTPAGANTTRLVGEFDVTQPGNLPF